jgi:hypothetical protein
MFQDVPKLPAIGCLSSVHSGHTLTRLGLEIWEVSLRSVLILRFLPKAVAVFDCPVPAYGADGSDPGFTVSRP